MKLDRGRLPGYYWVRFEGVAVIAEYARPARGSLRCAECGLSRGHWHFAGVMTAFDDHEICELLSGRLDPPKP